MDFETALHNAVKSVWPTSRVTKCSFHLLQAVKRAETRIFGVTAPSKTELTNTIFRLCTGFPYVEWDPERVELVSFISLILKNPLKYYFFQNSKNKKFFRFSITSKAWDRSRKFKKRLRKC